MTSVGILSQLFVAYMIANWMGDFGRQLIPDNTRHVQHATGSQMSGLPLEDSAATRVEDQRGYV